MPVGEVVSVGWGAAMPVGVTTWVVMGGIHHWMAAWTAVVARWRVWGVPSEAAASVMVGMVAGLWPTEMSHMSETIIDGVWSVPSGVSISMSWTRSI